MAGGIIVSESESLPPTKRRSTRAVVDSSVPRPHPEEDDVIRMAPAPARLIREPIVLDRIGLSSTSRWRLERAGKFPRGIKISPGARAWLESDVDAWIAARVADAAVR